MYTYNIAVCGLKEYIIPIIPAVTVYCLIEYLGRHIIKDGRYVLVCNEYL